jgi:hypothetical protein
MPLFAGQPIADWHIVNYHAGCEMNKVHWGKVGCEMVVLLTRSAVHIHSLPEQHLTDRLQVSIIIKLVFYLWVTITI